jgi:hypothetical protein
MQKEPIPVEGKSDSYELNVYILHIQLILFKQTYILRETKKIESS